MPHLLWRSGVAGEGILQYVKPLINGLKKGWNTSCHSWYMIKFSLQQVRKTHDNINIPDQPHKSYSYFKYTNIEAVWVEKQNKRPLSGVLFDNDVIAVLTNNASTLWRIELTPGPVQ